MEHMGETIIDTSHRHKRIFEQQENPEISPRAEAYRAGCSLRTKASSGNREEKMVGVFLDVFSIGKLVNILS